MHHHRIGSRGGSSAPGAGERSLPGPGQIMGLRLQSAEALWPSEEQAPGGDGAQAHLVGIDGDGGDAGQGEIPSESSLQEGQDKAAEGCVHMQVDAPLLCHTGQILDRIHLAELGGPGYSHQGHRLLVQQAFHRREVHFQALVQISLSHFQREKIAYLVKGEMGRGRDHYIAVFNPRLISGCPDGLDIGLSAAGGDIATGIGTAQQLAEHCHNLLLQIGHAGKEAWIAQVCLQEHVVSPDRNGMGQGAHGGEEAIIAVISLSGLLQQAHNLILRKAFFYHFSPRWH